MFSFAKGLLLLTVSAENLGIIFEGFYKVKKTGASCNTFCIFSTKKSIKKYGYFAFSQKVLIFFLFCMKYKIVFILNKSKHFLCRK